MHFEWFDDNNKSMWNRVQRIFYVAHKFRYNLCLMVFQLKVFPVHRSIFIDRKIFDGKWLFYVLVQWARTIKASIKTISKSFPTYLYSSYKLLHLPAFVSIRFYLFHSILHTFAYFLFIRRQLINHLYDYFKIVTPMH